MSNQVHYAGFWVRAIADFVDSLVLDAIALVIILVTLGCAYWIQRIFGPQDSAIQTSFMEVFSSLGLQAFLVLVRGALSLLYYGWGTFRFETTLGKRMLNIVVVSRVGEGEFAHMSLRQSMIRCCCYPFSYLPFGAGFLMAGFHPEKRALHDLIAGTVSLIRKKSLSVPQET